MRVPLSKLTTGLAITMLLGTAACTWVPLTDGGGGVRLAQTADVSECTQLGATHAKTSDRVWIFARSLETVDDELEALARNEAAEMGATAIVPQGPSAGGRRSFDVYRCDG
ncbi:MAG: DUF4156 domain-containing protein [Myxococcota bacterium]